MRYLRRPSPAMVVALIALTVALGGTSVAAVSQLAANSVGTSQLKNNAVTTPKIKNNAVASAKIAGNAVTSAKIKNGQVQPADLSASAKTSGPPGPPGPTGPTGPQGPAGVAPPGYIAGVASDTSTQVVSTSSTGFVDITGADETITVPTGETARLYVTFSAESICSAAASWCSVRITVDGTEIEPAAGTNYAFDSGAGSDQWEGHAFVRASGTLAAGSHVVRAQFAVVGGGVITLDDWAMVIERQRLS